MLDGAPLPGCPFPIDGQCSSPTLPRCQFHGPGLLHCIAGEPASITFQAVDAQGNALREGGEAFQLAGTVDEHAVKGRALDGDCIAGRAFSRVPGRRPAGGERQARCERWGRLMLAALLEECPYGVEVLCCIAGEPTGVTFKAVMRMATRCEKAARRFCRRHVQRGPCHQGCGSG